MLPLLRPHQDDEATLTLVQRHLLRGTATEALDALLSWSQLEFADDDATAAAAAATSADATASSSSSSWTPATRSKLVKSLPPEVGQPLGKALEATGATDPQVRLCWGFGRQCREGLFHGFFCQNMYLLWLVC